MRGTSCLPQVGGMGSGELKEARVAVIGAGGIGSAVIPALAGAGVGTLTIIDSDVVEVPISSGNRSSAKRDAGYSKADIAACSSCNGSTALWRRGRCRHGSM